MSQPPTPYTRAFDFTDFSAMQPSAQQPGQKIDQELNLSLASTNATISRLNEIQRDDGKLRTSALDLTELTTIAVPPGGTTGQVLAKTSNTSYATAWTTLNLTQYVEKANNLSDLANAATARTNLGLGTMATQSASNYLPLAGGTMADTVSIDLENTSLDSESQINGVHFQAQRITNPTEFAEIKYNAVVVSDDAGNIIITPNAIIFPNASVQTIAFPGFAGYATLASPAFTGNPTSVTPATSDNDTSIATTAFVKAQGYLTTAPVTSVAGRTGVITLSNTDISGLGSLAVVNDAPSNGSQYARKNAAWDVVIPGDRYLTTSTTSNTINNANKTFTIGTGLSYTPTQNITISYDAANHMHGEVLTYSTSTGVLTVDIKNHTGSGTYAAWVVNVGGVTPATSVAWGDITGTLSTQTDLQNALDLKSNLASPTFTGTPSLPTGTTGITQTAGNNTTALATTAFVTTSNPDASTTVKGHVELATNAEAQLGSSDTLAMSPSAVQYARLATTFFRLSALASVGATSGTGSAASVLASGYNSRSPTTAVGYGILSFAIFYHSRGSGSNSATPLPWNKRFVAQFRFHPRTLGTDANTINRVLFGKTGIPVAGELTQRGVGVRQIANGALELVVHNGTTFTAVTSSYTPANLSSTDLRIVSDGAGNVTLFNNDSQIATTSAGPSTAGSTNNTYLTVESENLATITGTNNTLYTAEMSFEFALL